MELVTPSTGNDIFLEGLKFILNMAIVLSNDATVCISNPCETNAQAVLCFLYYVCVFYMRGYTSLAIRHSPHTPAVQTIFVRMSQPEQSWVKARV